MVLSNIDSLKKNLQDFCKNKPKRVQFLKMVNGRRNYIELSNKCGITTPANCISLINEAEGLELTIKNPKTNLPDKSPLLKGKNIDSLLRDTYNKKSVSLKPKNITDLTLARKNFKKYLVDNFQCIENFFDATNIKNFKPEEIALIANKIITLLEDKKKNFQIDGLELRFFMAFIEYFNENRAEQSKLLNKFSSLVKLYEPFLKKFLVIKTGDEKWFRMSIDEKMLRLAYNLADETFKIKETEEDYWKKRTPKESSIRIAFKYRNIESHSATNLKYFDMDKIIYYIFAAIIFLFEE